MRMRLLVPLLSLLGLLSSALAALEQGEVALADGTFIHYVVVLPEGYTPTRTYPALLAFPGGSQSIDRAVSTTERFWEFEAKKRGVIVISPAAPSPARPYYVSSDIYEVEAIDLIPEFLGAIRSRYSIDPAKIHLAGHSNGGVSAFRLGVRYPELFDAMTVIAGCPAELIDYNRLELLRGMRISFFVGAIDADWRNCMTITRMRLESLGIPASLVVVPRNGHLVPDLSFQKSGPIFDTVIPPS